MATGKELTRGTVKLKGTIHRRHRIHGTSFFASKDGRISIEVSLDDGDAWIDVDLRKVTDGEIRFARDIGGDDALCFADQLDVMAANLRRLAVRAEDGANLVREETE